jgi:ribosomal protein S18 acetylase RimI-like enzyme
VGTTGGIVLKDYDATRLDELIVMWRASFEAGVGIRDPHPLADQKRYFLDRVLPHFDVRFAWVDETLAGFVAADAQSVAQLYVRVDLRGRGIGPCLLAWAKSQSSGSLWLYTFARNTAARAFYERHGFVVEARGFEPMWQLDDIRYRWQRAPS